MVTAFFKLCSQNHSLVCTVTILSSFFPFLYALLGFDLKTLFHQVFASCCELSRREPLLLARASRCCCNGGGGSYGGWIPLEEPSPTSAWAPGFSSSFLLEANPRVLSCRLKPGLAQVHGEAFGRCVCSLNSCWVFRDLAAQNILCSAVWVPAKLKSSEGQSWRLSVIASC